MHPRSMVAALVTVGAALALGGAPAAAATPRTESPPNPLACRYRDRTLHAQLLDAQQAAEPTWPQQRLEYASAWAFGRGAGVTVAVVDSGVDAAHEQLRGHVENGYDVTSGAVRRGGASDCAAHGTLVAGIIAAQPRQGRAMVGVAPDAMILPVRQTWGIDSSGQAVRAPANALLRAMQVAVDSGASVVNVSVTVPDVELLAAQREAFSRLAQHASERNVLIVAATGNRSEYPNYSGQNIITYPARLASWYPNVIAVSGILNTGEIDPDAITGPFVTVAAPDAAFPSTMDRGGLIACKGTSFAAPFVSGLAALVRGRYPKATAAQVRERIVDTADHPSTDLPNAQVGYGVINPVAAMTAILPASTAGASAPAAAPPMSGESAKDALVTAVAVGSAAGALLLAGVLIFGADVVRRGHSRGWRPGIRPEGPPAAASGRRMGLPG